MSPNPPKQRQTIKDKGAKAYHDGLTIDACPYATLGEYSRRYRRIWLAGYYEARGDIPKVVTDDRN